MANVSSQEEMQTQAKHILELANVLMAVPGVREVEITAKATRMKDGTILSRWNVTLDGGDYGYAQTIPEALGFALFHYLMPSEDQEIQEKEVAKA
jgi:hypothetical protein